MSVTKEVRDFISNSLAENNRALLTQISKLVSDSAENLKRANAEAADEQLRQVKKLRREEPKSFKRKGNEIQYKFNSKLQDSLEEAKTHLETNAVEKAKESLTEGTLLLTNRQKINLNLVGKQSRNIHSTSWQKMKMMERRYVAPKKELRKL